MKKSEMIFKMVNFWNKTDNNVSLNQKMEELLDYMERIGMTAPFTDRPIIISRDGRSNDVTMVNLKGGNGWELE